MNAACTSADGAKTAVLLGLIRDRLDQPPSRILVVGCGSSHDAGILARTFRAETCGFDIGAEFAFDHEAAKPATLHIMAGGEIALLRLWLQHVRCGEAF